MLHELVHTCFIEDVKLSPTFNLVCILAVVMLLLRCCMSWTTSFSSRVLQLSLIVASNISANQLQEVKENFSPIYTIMPANIEIHQRVLTIQL